MALMGDKAPSGSARRWLCSEQITPYKGEEKWRGGGRVGKAEEAGEGVPISQSPTPTRHSLMTRGKALKSRGAVPQTLFPESGGGSLQQSHGDPCCGARETEEGVQVLKKKC